jgi:hypothetical protein
MTDVAIDQWWRSNAIGDCAQVVQVKPLVTLRYSSKVHISMDPSMLRRSYTLVVVTPGERWHKKSNPAARVDVQSVDLEEGTVLVRELGFGFTREGLLMSEFLRDYAPAK